MEEDYSDLFEKEFIVSGGGELTREGKLVDIDFDIGVTIIDKNDEDHYIYCLRGESYYGEKERHIPNPPFYKEVFEHLVAGIRLGSISRDDIEGIKANHNYMGHSRASSANCAFSK